MVMILLLLYPLVPLHSLRSLSERLHPLELSARRGRIGDGSRPRPDRDNSCIGARDPPLEPAPESALDGRERCDVIVRGSWDSAAWMAVCDTRDLLAVLPNDVPQRAAVGECDVRAIRRQVPVERLDVQVEDDTCFHHRNISLPSVPSHFMRVSAGKIR